MGALRPTVPDRPLSMVGFGYKQSWLAVRDGDRAAVLEILGLRDLGPVPWREGVDLAYLTDDRLAVTPALPGAGGATWLLIAGRWLEKSVVVADLAGLSERLGTEVQFFSTHRVVEAHRWERAVDGVYVRSFEYVGESGEVTEWLGAPDATELAIGLPSTLDAAVARDGGSAVNDATLSVGTLNKGAVSEAAVENAGVENAAVEGGAVGDAADGVDRRGRDSGGDLGGGSGGGSGSGPEDGSDARRGGDSGGGFLDGSTLDSHFSGSGLSSSGFSASSPSAGGFSAGGFLSGASDGGDGGGDDFDDAEDDGGRVYVMVGEDDVMRVAAAWSVDPTSLDGRRAPGPLHLAAAG